jgi:hypothetical protein
VRVDEHTRVERSAAIGDRVEVRGALRPDGGIRATRIRRR